MLMFCSEKSVQCALDSIQILGGNGYINDYPTGNTLKNKDKSFHKNVSQDCHKVRQFHSKTNSNKNPETYSRTFRQ